MIISTKRRIIYLRFLFVHQLNYTPATTSLIGVAVVIYIDLIITHRSSSLPVGFCCEGVCYRWKRTVPLFLSDTAPFYMIESDSLFFVCVVFLRTVDRPEDEGEENTDGCLFLTPPSLNFRESALYSTFRLFLPLPAQGRQSFPPRMLFTSSVMSRYSATNPSRTGTSTSDHSNT